MARILLVDDDLSVRTVVSLMLARGGHSVDVAASGEEAIVVAAENPPDLVLSDLCMPGMRGDEVLRKIKEEAPFSICFLMRTLGECKCLAPSDALLLLCSSLFPILKTSTEFSLLFID
ncbi:MAG: response regulator [Proteobacteria bacterium]|nr:MAG: response regulator [Pseudomonadota bacterium]